MPCMTSDALPIQTNAAYGAEVEFRVLGPLEAVEKGLRLDLGGPKQRAVLSLLIANAGRQVSVGTLIEGVYGDFAGDRAHRSIHTFISNLRGVIGEVIEREGDGYVFTAARTQVDALQFEDAVQRGLASEDPGEARELLREALELWRGHPYAEVEAHTLLEPDVTRLGELRLTALEGRIDADMELGRDRELIAELETLTTEHPLNEHLRSQQMLALYRAGRQGDALRASEKTRAHLVEMGLDPSAELRELEQRILSQDTTLILDLRPTVRRASVLVADVADPDQLASLQPEERHRLISAQSAALDHAIATNSGSVFSQRGSAVYSWFGEATDAATAASEAQMATAQLHPRLRIAIATGDVDETTGAEVSGPPISRAAALVAVGHGGQVLLSADAHTALTSSGSPGFGIRSLGSHSVPGMQDGELIYQLEVEGEAGDFPALRLGEIPPPLPISERGVLGYELREVLGVGHHGEVHRAYQPSIGREVAIKVVRPEFASDAEFIRRFEVEAQLVARLEHPSIVPVYDYWREPEGAFLVMRLLRDGNLADRLASGPLAMDDVDRLARSLGSALDYAHRHGVVHTRITPSNVLFDEEGNAYLSDFNVGHTFDLQGDLIAHDVQQLARLIDRCAADKSQIDSLLAKATAEPGFQSAAAFVEAWTGLLGRESDSEVRFTPARNPYKGLRAFGELDAADFYGRADETRQLIDALRDKPFVAVVGPSGIGKSSVVRAGLIAAVRSGALDNSDRWLVTDMIPGRYPYEELASALLRVASVPSLGLEDDLRRDARGLVRAANRYLPEGSTLLLVVDQFEELFTLVEDDEERAEFLELLATAATDERSDVRIVLTMRADFFDRPLRFGEFGDLLRDATVPIAAPTQDSMRAIIEQPAVNEGVAFEPGLVDRILADVSDQPGALPLLEFSLTELFDGRDADQLTSESYGRSGGVLGALGRRAESIYQSLPAAEQAATRQLFLRLVQVDESGRDTRRRARRAELTRLGIDRHVVNVVLAAFGDHRLLTFDRDPITRGPTAEVAHEAILTEWPTLVGWIEDQREDLLLQRRLTAALGDWEEADRADSYLLTGGRLAQHLDWAARTELNLTTAEQEYLDNSRAADDQRLASRRRRRQAIMAGFGVAAVVASVLAVRAFAAERRAEHQAEIAVENEQLATDQAELALENERRAEEQADLAIEAERRAEEQARLSLGESLAANAVVAMDNDPELALLLATEAIRVSPEPTSISTMHQALQRHRARMIIPVPDGSSGAWGIIDPLGERVAVVGENSAVLQMWDIGASDPTWEVRLTTDESAIFRNWSHLWFSEDGRKLYVPLSIDHEWSSGPGQGLYTIDASTGEELAFLGFPCLGRAMPAGTQFVAPGAYFAFDWDIPTSGGECTGPGAAGVIDIGTGERLFETTLGLGSPPSLSRDGRFMAVGGGFLVGDDVVERTRVFDTITEEVVFDSKLIRSVLSYDGTRLLAGDNPTYLYDVESGERLQTYQGDFVRFFFTPDEERVVGSDSAGTTVIFDTASGAELTRLRGHAVSPQTSSVDKAGRRLVSSARDGAIVWDVASAARGDLDPVALPTVDENRFFPRAISKSDDYLLVRRGGWSLTTVERMPTHWVDILRIDDGATLHTEEVWWAELSRGGVMFTQPILAKGETTPAGVSGAVRVGAPRLVDAATGDLLVGLEGCEWWIGPEHPEPGSGCGDVGLPNYTTVQFSADGSVVLAGTAHGAFVLWDAQTGRELTSSPPEWTGTASQPWMGALSPDGRTLITPRDPTEDGPPALRVLDVASMSEIASIPVEFWVGQLEFDEMSRRIFGVTWGSDLKLVDPQTWSVTTLERSGGGRILAFAFSPDGRRVGTVGFSGIVTIWDLENQSIAHEIQIEGDIGESLRGIEFLDNDTILVAPESGAGLLRFTFDPEALQQLGRDTVNRGFLAEECATYNIDPCPTLEEMRDRS